MSRRKGGTLSNRYHSNGYVTQPTHPKKTALPPIATDVPENSHKKRPPKGSLQKLERFLCLHGRYRAHVRDWCGAGVFERHDFPSIFLLNQLAQQLVVQRVAGLEALELTNQAIAQQVEVADCIENLVLDEFVFITKTVLVQHAIGIDHDRVFNTAAECEVVLAQVLDVTHETKGTGAADRSEERRVGKECGSPCRARGSQYH